MEMKFAIARRQLGTALDLFIEDLDPVSVHCLACGGGELAHQLAKLNGKEPWIDTLLRAHPDTTLGHWLKVRNEYWNAMKHASTKNGSLRDDEHLLRRFTDHDNGWMLYIGIYDFGYAGGLMPLEAYVFMFWMLAMYPEFLDVTPDDIEPLRAGNPSAVNMQQQAERMFPGVRQEPRARAKKKIRSVASRLRRNPRELRPDKPYDRRKLILGQSSHPLNEDVLSGGYSPKI